MANLSWAKKADELLGAPPNLTTLGVAQVNALLAVACATREVQERVKSVADGIAAAAARPEAWVVWVDDAGARHAQNVDHIRGFREDGAGTAVLFDDGTAGTIPLSFGAVAFQVGA